MKKWEHSIRPGAEINKRNGQKTAGTGYHMRPLLPRLLRLLFPGEKSSFVFDRHQAILPSRPDGLNLYIHLPFCRSICHFCPYVKVPYDTAVSAAYQDAVIKELDSYRRIWGDVNIESVYFGGGTPSLTPEIVESTLSWIAGKFHLGHEVGVEIHPLDASPQVINSLKHSGVTMVSLGAQSFNDRLLKVLGRGYNNKAVMKAYEQLVEIGFDTIDIDLIFAVPSEKVEEFEEDIETACKLGAGQISSYPLIPFSYTPIKTSLKKAGLSMPSWRLERKMLQLIVNKTRNAGYQRTSIWSFNRTGTTRYTTVTRDAFIGIGAGASSRTGDYFWLNTFSVADYIRTMEAGSSPLALATRLNPGDRMAYWLFWQCYNTAINTGNLKRLSGGKQPRRIKAFLSLLNLLGMACQEGDTVRLTDSGAYLFHLVEKSYTHAYLETLWQACLREAWPRRVVL